MATAQSGRSADEFRWANVRNGHRQPHGGVAPSLYQMRVRCVRDLASAIRRLRGEGGGAIIVSLFLPGATLK